MKANDMRGACHTDLLRHQGLVELPAPAPVTDGEHSERPVALGGLVLQPRQLGGQGWREGGLAPSKKLLIYLIFISSYLLISIIYLLEAIVFSIRARQVFAICLEIKCFFTSVN
jgi:hypothetical protein